MNEFLMQFQSDILDLPVERPAVNETTALGAAYLAGLAVGFWDSLDEVRGYAQSDRTFTPTMSEEVRAERYGGWKKAVHAAMAFK